VWSLFRRTMVADDDVTVPEESFVALQAESDGLPDIRLVNQALDALSPKAAFGWHLSIIIDMAEHSEHGLPTKAEQAVLARLAEGFRSHLQADGNAVLLASITWNGTRQLVFRVRDPERANAYLTSVVESAPPVRQLEFRMEADPAWALAEQYLKHGRGVA
jgi:hypothetical protein